MGEKENKSEEEEELRMDSKYREMERKNGCDVSCCSDRRK